METIIENLVSIFQDKIPNELTVFIISMLPILELRGGLIAATLLGMHPIRAFIFCFIGNMLPIPFILLFIRKIFDWMRDWRFMGKVIKKLEAKADKHRKTIEKYSLWGLLLLVAIPLPGTGGWTGALVAALMDIRLKHALPVIAVGVLIASFIVGALSYGLLGGLVN
ncbi:MAG: small multi-drug export protein [Clostridia bacterium]|nr:small multi-drug export protein [Clostridia bacterium]